MLTRSLVLLALCVALVFTQEGEFVLRRAPNPATSTAPPKDDYFSAAVLEGEALHRSTPPPTKPGDYFGAAALEGDALRRTPEPTKKDDYYWNAAVDKQNEAKPVAVVATTLAPAAAQAAPLTQQQLVEKLRVAREKINSDAVVKRQQIAVAQQKFVDAKDSCKRMVGKYKGIAKKIRDNVKKAQKSGNTLAVKRGKKAISNLKGRFKKDVLKCKQKVQSAKNTLLYKPFTSDNQPSAQDPALAIRLKQLRQVAQKQIKVEQNKVKRARKAHAKKLTKDFKKATDAAKKGNKTKLVKFVKKARKDAKKEIHQVLKFTQEAAKNTDVFTAKKMFIKARKHVKGIKKNFRSMKSKAKKALRAGKGKKSAKQGKKHGKKNGKKSTKKTGKKGKKHGKKTHKKSGLKSKRVIVKNNLVAKKAERTIVLALKTGDGELLEKGRRLARKARKVVKRSKKHHKKHHKKSSSKKTKKAKKNAKKLAKKAKRAQRKYKKMLKSGRTKCRSKKAFRKFKRALKRARKNAKKLSSKAKKAKKVVKKLAKKANKKHAKKSHKKHAKKHAKKHHKKSNKARKCPK